MLNHFEKLRDFFSNTLWYIDLGDKGGIQSLLITSLRVLYSSAREFSRNELTLRSMSLVYTTLLSLIPLLAVSFSVLKGFGVHNQLEPLLLKFLAPLGDKGADITNKILEFVSNMKVGILGSIGFVLLFYTVISLIKKIEDALNLIWKVRRGRSFARRFSDYISITLLGPVLLFAAIGLTASASSNTLIQELIKIKILGLIVIYAGKGLSYLIVIVAFTFIYILIPNTKIKIKSALIGGSIAGILWQLTGWFFASFVASSTQYTAIYSSFAVLIIFLIWLYMNWTILLIGAQISYCHQNILFLNLRKEAFKLSSRLKEKLALIIMYLISDNYFHNKEKLSIETLTEKLGIQQEDVLDTVNILIENNILIETSDDPPYYIPAKDIGSITLSEILKSVRKNSQNEELIEKKYLSYPKVNEVMSKIENTLYSSIDGENFRKLVSDD